MLFPLNPNTPRCHVFEILNDEVLYFLNASIRANTFDENLFSLKQLPDGQQIRSVCWTNLPTRIKFESLWNLLPQDQQKKGELFALIQGSQDIAVYFDNSAIPLPELTEDLFDVFKSLTSHLFIRTKDLSVLKDLVSSSIEQHFQEFKQANNNSQLCFLCGTAHLSQNRNGLNDADQWRADYDHILCKDKYPIFSVHPGNFVPTCHICNSKAKGARNILKNKSNQRRTAFYPLPPSQESCYQYTEVVPKFRSLQEIGDGQWQDPLYSTSIIFPNAPNEIIPKIDVWHEVYQVPERVSEHVMTHFCERVSSDLRPRNFEDFCEQLIRFSELLPSDYKLTEWRFWWHKVYEYLSMQNKDFLNDVWSLIQWKKGHTNDRDMKAEFGF